MENWVDGLVNLRDREGDLPCPKCGKRICDQILAANVRVQGERVNG